VIKVMLAFFIITLLYSCERKDELELELRERFLLAPSFSLNENYLGKKIESPSGAWVNLIDFSEGDIHFCLNYKIPSKRDPIGALRLNESRNCKDSYFERKIAEKKGVTKLEISRLRSHIVFSFEYFGENQVIDFFSFTTKVKTSSFSLHDRLHPEALLIKEKSKKALRDFEFCERVNHNCKVVQEYRCGLCKRGFSLAKDSLCFEKMSKVCGRLSCGGQGELACILGGVFPDPLEDSASECEHLARGTYCNQGLRVSCDERGIVVCEL